MDKFVIKTDEDRLSSVNRTIRIRSEYFDKLMELSEKHGLTFNKLVNQCIEYALKNLAEE